MRRSLPLPHVRQRFVQALDTQYGQNRGEELLLQEDVSFLHLNDRRLDSAILRLCSSSPFGSTELNGTLGLLEKAGDALEVRLGDDAAVVCRIEGGAVGEERGESFAGGGDESVDVGVRDEDVVRRNADLDRRGQRDVAKGWLKLRGRKAKGLRDRNLEGRSSQERK